MVETVIPSLLDMYDSIDLNVRHGSVLATGEILEALYAEYRDDITITIGRKCPKNYLFRKYADFEDYFNKYFYFHFRSNGRG